MIHTVPDETEPPTEEPVKYSIISNFRDAVRDCSAASQLPDENVNGVIHVYSPEMTLDGDLSTCWAEGKSDDGVGETIRFDFNDNYKLSGFELYSGLCTSRDLFEKNSRIHEFTLTFSDGKELSYEIGDGYDNCHILINFSGEQPITDYVELTIDSVYKGNKYSDTCISEVSFY